MTSSIFEQANDLLYKPGGIERSLLSSRPHDDELARAYETGEAHTRKASRGPRGIVGRIAAQFIQRGQRRHPVSPDREASRTRRRKWCGGLPVALRSLYTEGERAVLAVIADQVKKHGCCDLAIDAIAALAGVGRTTVQNTLRAAQKKEHGHIRVQQRPRPGRKNLTNLITIISKSWLGWLKRSIGFKASNPSKTEEKDSSRSEYADRSQRAYERESAATSAHWGDAAPISVPVVRPSAGKTGSESYRQVAACEGATPRRGWLETFRA